MAACTSRAAASILRERSNCIVMLVEPSWLVEVIWLTPAMRPNWRSSGVATDDAIVSGLAPGNPAPTLITGYSTWGIGATGRRKYARMPAINSPIANNDVATGRRINGAEMFMLFLQSRARACGFPGARRFLRALGREGEGTLSSEGSQG